MRQRRSADAPSTPASRPSTGSTRCSHRWMRSETPASRTCGAARTKAGRCCRTATRTAGKDTDGPAFQRLMADVDAGHIDVIVVYKLDRFTRSVLDFARLMERLDKAGAAFVSITESFSTADPVGRLILHVL